MLWQPTRGILQAGQHWRRGQGGGAPAFPSTLANLVAWYSSDVGVTTSSGNVTQVLDQSGNGYTLTNSGTVPFNAASAYNSQPAFDFVAANGAVLKTATNAVAFPATGSFSAFMVCRLASASTGFSGGIIIGTGSGNDYNVIGNAEVLGRIDSAATIQTTDSLTCNITIGVTLDANMRLGMVSTNAINTQQYVNNVGGPTGPPFPNITTPNNIIIGNRYLGGAISTTGHCWQGPILEIVVTGSGLSSTERNSLDSYFTTKWGT